ncbi:Hypothetical protein CINCED_3A024329 [Cinara cedri]|uniref:Uncharacterized protein n=1 Tax=Cinara cedri TaxID=506608 RepID=A0A5E4NAG9_9HEMI|nr:Hypothetical protein CINCED_3A024329 [Cinara cedri]
MTLARPRPRLGLQDQDLNNTNAATPRPKQTKQYKDSYNFVFSRKYISGSIFN